MKNLITYSLFESFHINENEIESVITDICSDFIDEYDLSIYFSWGFAVSNSTGYDLRKDSEIRMFRKNQGTSIIKNYIKEVDNSNIRFVTVEFGRPSGYSTMNIWKDGIEDNFKKIMDFSKDYFPNVQIITNSNHITPAIWSIKFSIIFK